MTRFSDSSLTGWATAIGAALTAISMATLLIGYAVRMEAEIFHCMRAVDRLENHVETISDNVARTREAVAKIEGQLRPLKAADLQARQ